MLNRNLRVQATGFMAGDASCGDSVILIGVLIAPWFMNLVRLPVVAQAPGQAHPATGNKVLRRIGSESFEFIGAQEESVGAFEACSLFSPMFEFADQDAAVGTATEILFRLRNPTRVTATARLDKPSRRNFLFGRSGAETSR